MEEAESYTLFQVKEMLLRNIIFLYFPS
uniref:Uncharacterized protein n=1 Tax=Heterorhabditis bacteriophora TaxID=37862 RepID=A0A1I7X324_HETBA